MLAELHRYERGGESPAGGPNEGCVSCSGDWIDGTAPAQVEVPGSTKEIDKVNRCVTAQGLDTMCVSGVLDCLVRSTKGGCMGVQNQ